MVIEELYNLRITLQSVFHSFEVSFLSCENVSSECVLLVFKNHVFQNGCHLLCFFREEASNQ